MTRDNRTFSGPPHGVQAGSKAWTIVAFLSLLYAMSAIDRLILSLLVSPIKEELLFSDTQIGILIGLSFAVLYTLAGLPIARLADIGNRKWIVVSGVLLWSASTVASAFTWDYSSLLACRAGVAIGEAVLTPVAISMIADLFPKEKRSTPTAIYTAAGNVTAMTSGALGALVLMAATVFSPQFGDMPPWRLTMILVGIPGILLAIGFAVMTREPARSFVPPSPSVQGTASVSGTLASHLRAHGIFYFAIFGAIGLGMTVSYTLIAWMPTLLTREFGLTPGSAGLMFGTIGALSGAAGMLTTPKFLSIMDKAGRSDGILVAGTLMFVIAAPATMIAVLSPSLLILQLSLPFAMACLAGLALLPSLVVQQLSPPPYRAQMIAIYLLIVNLMGLGIGPALAGFLTDTVFAGNGGTGMSIAAMSVFAFPAAAALFLLARGPYRKLQAIGAA